jgi:uncharacterized membrane protein
MATAGQEAQERQVAWSIAALLRAGVALAAAVVLAGGVCYLIRHGQELAQWRAFRSEPADLRNLTAILHDALGLAARGIIQLGVLLLIATPIARVAFSALTFYRERDRTYVAITLGVLALLVYNLVWGWR